MEALHDIVNELLRGHARGFRLALDLLAVLIRAGEEIDLVAGEALVAGQRIGVDRAVGVADVQVRARILDRRCDVVGLLLHCMVYLLFPGNLLHYH